MVFKSSQRFGESFAGDRRAGRIVAPTNRAGRGEVTEVYSIGVRRRRSGECSGWWACNCSRVDVMHTTCSRTVRFRVGGVMNGSPRSAGACPSAAGATPASRTGPRPAPGRRTCSTAWRYCTPARAARTRAPCRRTGRSSRAPSARASSPGTAISRSLQQHVQGLTMQQQ